jgi:hypothetical protein
MPDRRDQNAPGAHVGDEDNALFEGKPLAALFVQCCLSDESLRLELPLFLVAHDCDYVDDTDDAHGN